MSAPTLSLLTTSVVPGVLVMPMSFFYMARVRSLLDIATGLARADHEKPRLDLAQDQASEALLFGIPVLVFLGLILWTGDTRGRLVALALAVPSLIVVGVIIARSTRR